MFKNEWAEFILTVNYENSYVILKTQYYKKKSITKQYQYKLNARENIIKTFFIVI